MHVYLARRFVYAIITFIGITIATFALIHAVPGDPIDYYIARARIGGLPPEVVAAIRAEHRLDDPLPSQYVHWLTGAARFDFGRSFVDRRLVTDRILEKLPNTLVLNIVAFVLAALIGVPLGLWSATRSGRRLERASAVLFFLLYSLPTFWVALLLMRIFSVELNLLPLFGVTSYGHETFGPSARIFDRAAHLVLPVITLAYTQIAIFARFSKSALTEVIRQDFITAARAKGVGEGTLMWHHALRNALIPLITLLGLTIPYLLSGSVIVEEIFQWDGIGRLYFESITNRDYPTALGLTVLTAVVTLAANVLADVLYALADPRVRLEGRQ